MKAVEIKAAEFGQVRSRKDHSVSFTIVTPELRASEAAAILALHGMAVRLLIEPHDIEPEETVIVDAQINQKTPSKRWRSVLFIAWRQGYDRRQDESFDSYYARQYENVIDEWKSFLKD